MCGLWPRTLRYSKTLQKLRNEKLRREKPEDATEPEFSDDDNEPHFVGAAFAVEEDDGSAESEEPVVHAVAAPLGAAGGNGGVVMDEELTLEAVEEQHGQVALGEVDAGGDETSMVVLHRERTKAAVATGTAIQSFTNLAVQAERVLSRDVEALNVVDQLKMFRCGYFAGGGYKFSDSQHLGSAGLQP